MGSQGKWKEREVRGLKTAVKGAEKESREMERKGIMEERKPNMKSMEREGKRNEVIEESCRRSGIWHQ
jgi:hypothetical protein